MPALEVAKTHWPLEPSMAVQNFPITHHQVARELLNQCHDLQVYDSSVPFEPEVRKRECRKVCANFGFGTLAALMKSTATSAVMSAIM